MAGAVLISNSTNKILGCFITHQDQNLTDKHGRGIIMVLVVLTFLVIEETLHSTLAKIKQGGEILDMFLQTNSLLGNCHEVNNKPVLSAMPHLTI